MFNKSRPVPSAAALRVLYQLAYISSGTAVGVAALCAEERRRRTHYVQKIADNAKRLRQSPRHVHNVAAAAKSNEHANGVDASYGEDCGGRQSEECHFERYQESDGQKEIHQAGKRLVRGSALPSAVEKGYAQVTRDHKRVRRRGPTEETSKLSGADERRLPRDSKSNAKSRPYQLSSSVEQTGTRKIRPNSSNHAAKSDFSLKISKFEPRPVTGLLPMFRLKTAAALVQNAGTETQREFAWKPGDVGHDVNLFLQHQPWTFTKLRDEARVASCLLREAVQHNLLESSRRMVSWKLANDKLQKQDVELLVEAFRIRDVGLDKSLDLFELFAEIFSSKAFGQFPQDWKLSITIPVAANAIFWDFELEPADRVWRLLATTVLPCAPDSVDVVIRRICDQLLTEGQAGRAFATVRAVRLLSLRGLNATNSTLNRRWKDVYGKIMDYSMKHGQLWTCKNYISLLLSADAGEDPDRISMAEWLVRECRRCGTYAPLEALRKDLLKSHLWKMFSDEAKVDLAIALTKLPRASTQSLEMVCREIPKPLLGPVVEAWCARRMQSVWRTKWNLPLVWKEYERMKTFQLERFGAAELHLIQICNEANQPIQALKLLSSALRHDLQNPVTLCMAAVSLARKSAWKQLRGLMTIIAQSGKFINNESTSRNLNDVIVLYSRCHAADETWKFVTDMIASFGFTPNRTTSNIMLKSFVNKQTIDLIPQWIRYLKTIGNDFQMNSRTATKLLSCFYHDQRPPHTMFLWFSRNLSAKWPSFDATGLKDVIKSSIGHDLRELPSQYKASIRERAKHDLARLDDADREIPKPYRLAHKTDAGSRGCSIDVPARQHDEVEKLYNFPPLVSQDPQNADAQHTPQLEISDADLLLKPSAVQEKSSLISHNNAPRTVSSRTQDFANLRLDYRATAEPPGESKDNVESPESTMEAQDQFDDGERLHPVIGPMILALSLRDYCEVLRLYGNSLSPTGLPASPLSLEVATEASIRLRKGDIREASGMLESAKLAGMDIRRAVGPLLINRASALDADKMDANSLRLMVIDFYRTNEENGFPVSHHMGITAANTLINNDRPEHGINILNSIYHSEWALERPLNIVAMTVYLKGYAMLKSEKGISFVLQKVLHENMPIDRPFLSALKDARSSFDGTKVVRLLRLGRQRCIERRLEQRQKTRVFGNLLVKRILSCVEMNRTPTIHVDSKLELEAAFFGGPMEREQEQSEGDLQGKVQMTFADNSTGMPGMQAQTKEHKATSEPSRLEARMEKARIAQSIRYHEDDKTTQRRTHRQTLDSAWLKQYRAFMKKDLVMADGKRASFRRYVW